MEDPVVAQDHHSYERSAIQTWFDTCQGNTTSPLTRESMYTDLVPNQCLKAQIHDWVEDQLRGTADVAALQMLQGSLFTVETAEQALKLLRAIGDLVQQSKFCLLGSSGVARIQHSLRFSNVLTDQVSAMLVVLADHCQDAIQVKREKHNEIHSKYVQLETITNTLKSKEEILQNNVLAMEKIADAAETQAAAARLVINTYNDAKQAHNAAQAMFDNNKESIRILKNIQTELFNDKAMIANELENISDSSGGSGGSGGSLLRPPSPPPPSSSSSSSSGSKRGRSSSFPSPPTGTSSSKRHKNDGAAKADHAGQWLFEEGICHYWGSKFKKRNQRRGQLMMEASATCGCPMAVAYCLHWGWNGAVKDYKTAFELFVQHEQESNGYHWVQYMLGQCYRCGYGVEQNYTKAMEWYVKASNQGNTDALNDLGYFYSSGHGCVKNLTKAAELFERSADAGYSYAMACCSICYEDGTGVVQNANTAMQWRNKASAQGLLVKELTVVNGHQQWEMYREE